MASKTVITFGTFDVFHVGHVRMLNRSAELGDRLIVGVSSDKLNFSNWPYYIDTHREMLKDFKKKYGTTVKYTEEINDNVEFFGKVMAWHTQWTKDSRTLYHLNVNRFAWLPRVRALLRRPAPAATSRT